LTSRTKHTGGAYSVCTSMADALHEKQWLASGFSRNRASGADQRCPEVNT
jgi:hypothetical protein